MTQLDTIGGHGSVCFLPFKRDKLPAAFGVHRLNKQIWRLYRIDYKRRQTAGGGEQARDVPLQGAADRCHEAEAVYAMGVGAGKL